MAHRGASQARAAREHRSPPSAGPGTLGADWVELDVRRTADGALAVHHDPTLPDGRVVLETDAADLPDRACRSSTPPSTPAPGSA